MRGRPARKNFYCWLRRVMEQQLRTPFEIILLTGVHKSSAFVFADRFERVVQSLIKFAQQAMSFCIICYCKDVSDLLASFREVTLGAVSQSHLVRLAGTAWGRGLRLAGFQRLRFLGKRFAGFQTSCGPMQTEIAPIGYTRHGKVRLILEFHRGRRRRGRFELDRSDRMEEHIDMLFVSRRQYQRL